LNKERIFIEKASEAGRQEAQVDWEKVVSSFRDDKKVMGAT
jgi:hypothetical protein